MNDCNKSNLDSKILFQEIDLAIDLGEFEKAMRLCDELIDIIGIDEEGKNREADNNQKIYS